MVSTVAKRAGGGHEPGPVAVVAEHAASEDLLDQDRDGSLPAAVATASTTVSRRPCRSSGVTARPRRSTATAPAPAEGLLLVGLVGVAALVVVAARRRGVGEDVDDGVVLGSVGRWCCRHAASAS